MDWGESSGVKRPGGKLAVVKVNLTSTCHQQGPHYNMSSAGPSTEVLALVKQHDFSVI